MTQDRSSLTRLLRLLLVLSIAVGPIASALHAESHLVRPAAAAFQSHDEASHRWHRAVDGHEDCVLCAHLKTCHALVTVGPDGGFCAPRSWTSAGASASAPRAPFTALPSPRGPPIAS